MRNDMSPFRWVRRARTALSNHDDRLIGLVDDAQPVGAIGERERVRRLGAEGPPFVLLLHFVAVQAVHPLERVAGDQDVARVRVDVLLRCLGLEARAQIFCAPCTASNQLPCSRCSVCSP